MAILRIGDRRSGVKWGFEITNQASPFRQNKKARRRQRKFAKNLANEKILAKWDEATATGIRRVAQLTMEHANAKRKKRTSKSK